MKKPKLSLEEIIKEIGLRTDLPLTGIRKVLMAYDNIANEAIQSEVECQILGVGVISWTVVPPTKRAEFRNWFKSKNGKGDWVVQENIDGFNKPLFRFFNSFKQDLKKATIVPFNEGEINR